MIILYIVIILIGAFPLFKTIRYILLEEKIRKTGISTMGVVIHVHTTRYPKGPAIDRVHTRYSSNITGHYHEANFTATYNKYRVGQSIPVKYLPQSPDKIVVAEKRGYWPMLIFTVLLFLFVVFAVYKINEMMRN